MIIKINRLWHGYASIRSYQAIDAINKHEDIIIQMDNEYMRIPYSDILGGTASQKRFKSKHGRRDYYLIDYPWHPREQQEQLL